MRQVQVIIEKQDEYADEIKQLFTDLLKKKKRSSNDLKLLMKLTEDMVYFQKINSRRINLENELHKKICLNLQLDLKGKGILQIII